MMDDDDDDGDDDNNNNNNNCRLSSLVKFSRVIYSSDLSEIKKNPFWHLKNKNFNISKGEIRRSSPCTYASNVL